jgi:hypothetical protein
LKHKKKMNRRERIADYINQRMEGFSKVPNVLADRALKIGALSFLALFLGSYMGRQMDSASFIAWSVVMWLSGIGYAFHLLWCGEKKEYETIEGTVYEIKGNAFPGVSVKWESVFLTENRLCY